MRKFIRRLLAKYRRPYWRVVWMLDTRGLHLLPVPSVRVGGCPVTHLLMEHADAVALQMFCDMGGKGAVPTRIERIDYNDPLVSLSHFRSKNA